MSVNLTYLLKLTEASKKIVRRNLPIDQDYNLVDTGTLDSENATTCQNCNMVITSYAEITNGKNTYTVGMDCLVTLLSVNSYQEQYKIAEIYGKMQKELRFRAYIRKLKKNNTLRINKTDYGIQIYDNDIHKYTVSSEYWNKLNIQI